MIDTYKSLCTEFYDLDKPTAPKEALEYYLKEVKKSTLPILEPMCGTGRFLIPILEQGIDIEGMDASTEMLESCKKKCAIKNLTPTLYYQKIQELTLPRKYGLIFIPSGSFGLITEKDEIQKSLKKLYDCLMTKGRLIIEIETPYIPSQNELIEIRKVTRSDFSKIKLTTTTLFDIKTNVQTTKCVYQSIVNEIVTLTETEYIKVKHYHINEFTELLKSAGISEIEALKTYSDEKATEQDSVILIQGVKTCLRPIWKLKKSYSRFEDFCN